MFVSPEWITAVATGATAFAACIAARIAFLSRRDVLAPPPVIEATVSRYSHQGDPDFVRFSVTVRNRLDETLIISSVRILKPHGMTFAKAIPSDKPWHPSGRYVAMAESTLDGNWSMAPINTVSQSPFAHRLGSTALDVFGSEFILAPPHGWQSGIVSIELRISSAALTICDRRIVVKRHVPAAPKPQTDAKASNHA